MSGSQKLTGKTPFTVRFWPKADTRLDHSYLLYERFFSVFNSRTGRNARSFF
jgi:hypothetical protein